MRTALGIICALLAACLAAAAIHLGNAGAWEGFTVITIGALCAAGFAAALLYRPTDHQEGK